MYICSLGIWLTSCQHVGWLKKRLGSSSVRLPLLHPPEYHLPVFVCWVFMGSAGDLIWFLILGTDPSTKAAPQGDLVGRLDGSDVPLPAFKFWVFCKLQSSLCFSL